MYKIDKVSDKELKQAIKKYRELIKDGNKNYTPEIHKSKRDMEEKAQNVCDNFKEGNLILESEQYQLFAEYIKTFGCVGKEECFSLLKQKAGYDVREMLNKDERSWWKKFRSKFAKPEIEYLSAKKLNHITKKHTSYTKKLSHIPMGDPKLSKKKEDIEYDAKKYMESYLNGKIKIKPEDVVAFKIFIKTIENPLYEGSTGEKALKKLESEYGEILAQAQKQQATILPMKVRAKKYIQNKTAQLKGHLTTYKKWYDRAAASIIGIITVGALWLGFKDNVAKPESNGLNDKKIDKKEALAQKQETKNSDEKMIHFEFVSNEYKGIDVQALMEKAPTKETKTKVNETKPAKETKAKVTETKPAKETKAKVTKARPDKEIGADKATFATNNNDSVKGARINHHKVVLAMRLGASKSTEMVKEIQTKMDKGLISLPTTLSAEDFLFAMEMYRGYGIECSLKDAFNNKQKLSEEQNKQVVKDIIAAGETGLGVKKMAAEMNGGHLSNKSVYDRASKKTQKQYNMNMKRWLKLKKQGAKAA